MLNVDWNRVMAMVWAAFVATGPLQLWILLDYLRRPQSDPVLCLAAIVAFLCVYVVPSAFWANEEALLWHEDLKARISETWIGRYFGEIGTTRVPLGLLMALLALPSLALGKLWPVLFGLSATLTCVFVFIPVAGVLTEILTLRAQALLGSDHLYDNGAE